jgi:hypothetical protein
MGNFYVNHTVRAPQDRVTTLLEREGHTAFMSPTVNGYTVVCDRHCDDQDMSAIRSLGRKLSASLNSPVVAFLNHDDDVLCYWLFEEGELIDEFNSCPDYFDEDDADDLDDEDETASGPAFMSDGEELCRALGRSDVHERVGSILAEPHRVFVSETHRDLVRTLGLPSWSVGAGYRYVAEGDAELDRGECVHVGRREGERRGRNTGLAEEE